MAMLTCCCPGCRTGYPETKRSKNDSDPNSSKPKYSLHIFPKDEELRRKWLRAINRELFVPSKYSRVCSRHFDQSCFRSERRDKNIYRSRTKASMPLRINVLKPDAIPTIFPDAPNIITNISNSTMLNTSAPTEERTVEEKNILHGPDTIFVVLEDAIIRFEDIQEKLDRSVMPPGVHVIYGGDSAVFMALSSTPSSLEIMYGLKVCRDLSYQVFLNGSLVSYHEVHHICPSKFIRCISDIYNIIAFLRNGRDVSASAASTSNIQKAIKLLESSKAEENEPGASNKLGFIIEQLNLHVKNPKGRSSSFSHELLQVANAWQSTDPALYNQIIESDLMYLPPTTILKKYTSDINAYHHEGVHQSVKIEYTIDQ